jgi:DNA-binding transcriptional ArsR family regulator
MRLDIDRVFDALGDHTRRAILDRLAKGPQSVSKLAEPLGVTITAIGQHMHILEEAGFVSTEKAGRTRNCRLESHGFKAVENWAAQHRMIWERRLDVLGKLLAEEDD